MRLAFDGDEASVTVSSDGEADLVVFEGPFRTQQHVVGEEPLRVVLRRSDRVADLSDKYRRRLMFSPDVFRLQFGGARRGKIYLHDIEGLPYRDVAAALGGRESSLRRTAARARRSLRRLIVEEELDATA